MPTFAEGNNIYFYLNNQFPRCYIFMQGNLRLQTSIYLNKQKNRIPVERTHHSDVYEECRATWQRQNGRKRSELKEKMKLNVYNWWERNKK